MSTLRRVRIDYPGDGAWIMGEIGGVNFDPDVDHVLANYDTSTGRILGGFVTNGFTGVSVQVHMAGQSRLWCSRDLMFNLFNYVFNKLGCYKAFATISTGNPAAIALDLRAGWHIETRVRGVYSDGDMLILYMDRDDCPWLKRLHGKQEHTLSFA